jgi:hypothetical protein
MIIIVQRNLQYDSNGYLISPSTTIDIEKRTIWQPWYKRRCNFAVRYIIPNREGILNIMKSKNRISHKVLLLLLLLLHVLLNIYMYM